MAIFNAFLNLSELKELYSGKPVCVCPLYNGVLNTSKTLEATGNPIVIPEYKQLIKLTTKFSPKQAGTGAPSLENIRPISGWDSVKVTVSNESESHDYNIILPKTIYGGTVDAVTGVGEKTWEFLEFDGTETWTLGAENESNISLYTINSPASLGYTDALNIVCNMLPTMPANINNVGIRNGGTGNTTSTISVTIPKSLAEDIDSWKSYLAAQAAAGTPVQVAYKLATPEPFENSQISIPSLGGENKFFTNGENMGIIYKVTNFWG